MRRLHLLCILLLACILAAQQLPDTDGLSPKAGAVSENVYTNVFFGFNLRFPRNWGVAFVASEGPCEPQCMLLEARAPGYPKLPRSLTVTAEAGSARPDHVASAALILEQSGARKLAGVQEIDAGARKLYRADYRSQLINSDLYQAIIAMPAKQYLVVFTFTAEDRKQLDTLADGLTKDLSFAGGKSSSQ